MTKDAIEQLKIADTREAIVKAMSHAEECALIDAFVELDIIMCARDGECSEPIRTAWSALYRALPESFKREREARMAQS